jgi:hypothetical protein
MDLASSSEGVAVCAMTADGFKDETRRGRDRASASLFMGTLHYA